MNSLALSAARISSLQTLYGQSTDVLSAIDNLSSPTGLITVAGLHYLT